MEIFTIVFVIILSYVIGYIFGIIAHKSLSKKETSCPICGHDDKHGLITNDAKFYQRMYFREADKSKRYRKQSKRKGYMIHYMVKNGYITKEQIKEISDKI
jgi:hypothetical protein